MPDYLLLESGDYLLQEIIPDRIIIEGGEGAGIQLQTNTLESVVLPFRFDADWDEYIAEVRATLEEAFRQVYYDITQGAIRFTVVDAEPNEDDLDDGMLLLYNSGGTYKLYARINGVVKSVELT